MASIGYGYTALQVMNLVRYLAVKYKNKDNFCVTGSFISNLCLKFPELSLRKISAYDYQRAISLTPGMVQKFFEILKTVIV